MTDTRPKILIIDDEEVVLDSCTEILEGTNVDIATASDARRGLELVREFQPGLVFVDLKMPGMSGFEVLEHVHALDPTIVPIVITGYATVSSAVEAMKKGAYDFLPKPFTPDEFRLITRRGLEKRRLVLETLALRREKEILQRNFAAVVSHELKAPLGAVQQNLYVLLAELSGKIPQEQVAKLERMKVRIDDLLKMIQTWLGVSAADIEKIREKFGPVGVETVIHKAAESAAPLATRQGIEIVCEAKAPGAQVFGDEGTLVEALVNLLSNAVRFSHAGDNVWIRSEAAGDELLLSVTDTGVGISEEELPLIFEGFYSGAAPTGEKGCGLGLTITKRVVEAHGGSISVQSEPGKGSTFTIRVPLLGAGRDSRPAKQLAGRPAEEIEEIAGTKKGGVR